MSPHSGSVADRTCCRAPSVKILLQSYRNGALTVADAPAPGPRAGRVLVRNAASLVSAGTERYQLELARKSLVGKALARPDLVAQVVRKARTDGIQEAWQQATQRLDVPIPLGYSSAGIVVDGGGTESGLRPGDHVACSGSGYASHAEIVSVPMNLCAPLPEGVDLESAAFVAVGGVALEAVRMSQVELGSRVLVIGLGLIGQIAVQLLRAAGCHVIGADVSERQAALAREHGAETAVAGGQADVLDAVRAATGGLGVDATVLLAATSSNEPLETAAEATRERGRVVAAGLVGLQLPRKPFFDKELELVVSRAWGPGLFDPSYAERGRDYPPAYARWTAGRNMAEFLAQIGSGGVRVGHLVTHRFSIDDAPAAYELITGGREPYLGVLLQYPAARAGDAAALPQRRVTLRSASPAAAPGDRSVGLGLIGAGLFARTTLLPALRGVPGFEPRGIATASGVSAQHTGEKHGFAYATTDHAELLRDTQTPAVIVATRHDLHADLAAEALAAGKSVLVEKPLAVDREGLDRLIQRWRTGRAESGGTPRLMVGFNRRHSPAVRQLQEWLRPIREPLTVTCRVNAGLVPAESWVHDPREGGGRIVGEVCHFVDLVQALTGELAERVYAETLTAPGYGPDENVVITLRLTGGGVATISYVATGDKAYPRERVEVFGGSAVGVIDNFRSVSFTRAGKGASRRKWNIDRGYQGELEAFREMARGGEVPVPFRDYLATTLATFAIEEALRTAAPVMVRTPADLE